MGNGTAHDYDSILVTTRTRTLGLAAAIAAIAVAIPIYLMYRELGLSDTKLGMILLYTDKAEKELKKVPFFVRGKARRNTETYARERGVPLITVDTLYDAKAHFSR